MKVNRILIVLALSLLALTAGGCKPASLDGEPANTVTVPVATETATAEPLPPTAAPTEAIVDETPTETPTVEPVPPTEVPPTVVVEEEAGDIPKRLVTFDQLGITLEVPEALFVIKDPMVNLDDPAKLESYLFYIQNYGQPGGPSSGDFQIYGLLQYSLPPVTWEEFAAGQVDSEMNAYADEIEINGLRGFDTQVAGERNRFVYHFFLDGHVLSLAVSQPTDENKAAADQIISTIQFDPAALTDASRVQLVVDQGGIYQIYLPEDWTTSVGTVAGIRLADLQARSADAEVVAEAVEGPHDNVLYKSGVIMSLVVLEDDSATMEPPAALIKRSQAVMYSGIEGTDYTFVEPSTVEGELRELRFLHNGLSYLLRFGYAPNADQEEIDWIIRNLQIQP